MNNVIILAEKNRDNKKLLIIEKIDKTIIVNCY